MTRRRFPHARRVPKWGLLAACVFLVALWAMSSRYSVFYITPKASRLQEQTLIGVLDGAFAMGRFKFGRPWEGGWQIERAQGFTWFGVHYGYPPESFVLVPLWIPIAILAPVAGVFLLMGRVHRSPGFCPRCRYDRAGLAEGAACPECGGKAVANGAPPRRPREGARNGGTRAE